MLDLSPDKLFVLAILATIVLGPQRIPAAARSVGRVLGQLRAMSASVQNEVKQALHEPEESLVTALAEFRPGEVRRTVRQAVTDTFAPAIAPAVAARPSPPTTSGVPAPPAGPVPALDARPTPDDPTLN
jgi:sec-independent protein translocase protein TatB